LNAVNHALAETVAAKETVIARQAAEMKTLQERLDYMERVMVVGADPMHLFEEQRDASLMIVRKFISDGRQLEVARQRLLEPRFKDQVSLNYKKTIRETLLKGKVDRIIKLVRLVQRSLFKHQHSDDKNAFK